METSIQALNPIGPRKDRIRALAVSNTAASLDLSTISELSEAVNGNQLLSLTAEGGDVWYTFSQAAHTIDRTNTTQGNAGQCDYLPAGASRDLHIPWVPGSSGATGSGACLFLNTQAAAASGTILRISVSSEALNQRAR